VASDVYGISQKVAHPVERKRDFDDATLAQKVMSELFRDQRIPKGVISVNVENGVVLLRGEVEHPSLIRRAVERTRRIGGVVDVESLLHLPGESVPRS
jgi:osmotically-inducible protein OsmY